MGGKLSPGISFHFEALEQPGDGDGDRDARGKAWAWPEHRVWGQEGSTAPRLKPPAPRAFLLLTTSVGEGFTPPFPPFPPPFCHGEKERIKDCKDRLTHIFLLGKTQAGAEMT